MRSTTDELKEDDGGDEDEEGEELEAEWRKLRARESEWMQMMKAKDDRIRHLEEVVAKVIRQKHKKLTAELAAQRHQNEQMRTMRYFLAAGGAVAVLVGLIGIVVYRKRNPAMGT